MASTSTCGKDIGQDNLLNITIFRYQLFPMFLEIHYCKKLKRLCAGKIQRK